jgi:WD40 repeat protein
VTVVSSVAAWRLNGERDATRGQLRLTQQAEAEGNHRLYRSLVEQARANRLTRRMGQRFKTLDVLTQAATQARELRLPESDLLELRNEAIACLVLPDLTVKKEWEGWPTGSMTMDFDDGLTRYARVDRQGAVSVRRVDNDAEICRLSAYGPGDYGPGEETWPCFTQDGQFLLLQRGEQVKVWELAGSDPRVSVELAGVAATAFSPSGRQLAVGGIDGSIVLYDLATGAVAKPVAAGPRAFGMAFHPHDQRLAASCASEVKIYDLESGSLVRSLFDSAGAFPVAWHPDGNILAGVVGRTVTFWDVATGKPVVQLRGHKSAGVNLAFDHAGDLLGTACWDGILRLWDVHTGQLLFNTHAGAYPLRFSPDDRLLGTGASGQTLRFWQVELGCGHRTLAPHRGFEQREYQACAVSPKHPILAAGTPDGLGLWHLTSGAPLVFIPSPGHRHVVFEPSGALVTNGPSELLRWPIREDPAAPDLLRIGPPQTLPLPGSWMQIANSRDGRVLASGQGDGGGLVWRQSLPGPPLPLLPHEDVRSIGVSPDGRWVATGSHWGTKVKIWDAYNGRLSRELPVEGGSRVEFSPDGKWLATTGGGCRLWSVDTWQPGPNLGGNAAMAFSRDTSLLALDLGYGAIRLVDPATGREYARLEDPNQDAAFWLCFSADGARLVSTTSPSRSIHVWDLRAIRAELAQMGLDWDLPPYSPALPDEERPLRIELTPATE